MTTEGKEKSENFKDKANDRIQNIIITQKELIQRWEAIGSQFESSIDNTTNFTNKPNKINRINNEAGIKIHSKNGNGNLQIKQSYTIDISWTKQE